MADDDVDLLPQQRRRIEQVHAALAKLSHYELLGVPRDADRKTIARAYLERTLEFQSSRYFARNLGRFRRMMDTIYDRVSTAYEVLRSPTRRSDYDDGARRDRLSSVEEMIRAEVESMREAHDDGRREHVPTSAITPRIVEEPPRTKSGVRQAVVVPAPRGRAAAG
jgi:curved DNA-binding protein CbpA